MHKGNLFDKINGTLHENSSRHIGPRTNKEQLFWAQVSPALLNDVYQTYIMDFEAFGYDPYEYLMAIGLNDTAQAFKAMTSKS